MPVFSDQGSLLSWRRHCAETGRPGEVRRGQRACRGAAASATAVASASWSRDAIHTTGRTRVEGIQGRERGDPRA